MTDAKLVYSQQELEADHSYTQHYFINDMRLHGGFDDSLQYIPPRTLFRAPAIQAWQQQLMQRNFPLVDASQDILKRDDFPNYAQHKLLLQHGLGNSLYNSLTITSKVESRGAALIDLETPDFQSIIIEDISQTALAHLNKGLLRTHGWDESGRSENGEHGHDTAWHVIRNLLFDDDAYPEPEVPSSIIRPVEEGLVTTIPEPNAVILCLLINILMVEIRAEKFFNICKQLMQDPELFTQKRKQAELAATMVERIRLDESIHVAYLQLVISEFRSFTIKTLSDDTMPGAAIIDPVWQDMVKWHSEEVQQDAAKKRKENLVNIVLAHPDGEAILQQIENL